MSVKDLLDSLRMNINQRVKSPFYGAFIISWIIFNWKPVLILLFSKKDINIIIDELSKYNSSKFQFWYPVLLTTVVITLLPLLGALYTYFDSYVGHWSDQGKGFKEVLNKKSELNRKLSEDKKKKENEELLAEKSAAIAKLKKQEQDDILQTEKIKQEIHDLPQVRQSINSLGLENESLKKKNDDLIKDLKAALAGEDDKNITLPWMNSPHQRIIFWGEVNGMRASRKSREQDGEGE
ncbi:hypothetical protein V461_21745 [Pantoea ananatis BRT98]|uniref:hypothetical protein n=1 Tax=Pantoea ananas TaxID=553 RepID=UPI001EE5AE56|nr:hypothetical protein [Pantoea ananatis]PKC39250.1 hypothetical protein V461_21745 [Pantoea ananatis BRT98]